MSTDIPVSVLLVGTTVVLALMAKSGFERMGVPALIGYLLLGLLFRVVDLHWKLLSPGVRWVYEFLATIGIICLLFEVGLKSNLPGLVRQLRRATIIWAVNVLFSGILGYITSYFILGLELIPSLFISIALTATSVGISMAVWREANALRSPNGELVVDVAELDDISGIIFMALLFTIVAVLREKTESALAPVLAETSGLLLVKLTLFGAFCYLFARYIEHPVTDFFRKKERPPDPMILVVGIGFLIAAIASLIGFSVAIGAFFAGRCLAEIPRRLGWRHRLRRCTSSLPPSFLSGLA